MQKYFPGVLLALVMCMSLILPVSAKPYFTYPNFEIPEIKIDPAPETSTFTTDKTFTRQEMWTFGVLEISKDCTVTVEPGAVVYVQYDMLVEGKIVNNGVIVVELSLVNAGGITNNGAIYVGSEGDKERRSVPEKKKEEPKSSQPEHPIFNGDGFNPLSIDGQVLKNSPGASIVNNGTINVTSTLYRLVGWTNYFRSGKGGLVKNNGTINLNCQDATALVNESGAVFDNAGTMFVFSSAEIEGSITRNPVGQRDKFEFPAPDSVARGQVKGF